MKGVGAVSRLRTLSTISATIWSVAVRSSAFTRPLIACREERTARGEAAVKAELRTKSYDSVIVESVLSNRSKPRVDPPRRIIEKVLLRVRVLAWRRFARPAGRETVGRAFDHHEVLVLAFRNLEIAFAVADVVMRAHGH